MEHNQQDFNDKDVANSVEETATKEAMEQATLNQEQEPEITLDAEPVQNADGDEVSANNATAEDADLDVAQLQSEIEALKAQLKGEQDKAKAALESMARAAAEADNRRKRAEADVEKERKFGNEKLLKALLPVVDSLDLALQHINKDAEGMQSVYEGIENTMTLFLKELGSFGVERLDPVGQPFDPNMHNAVSMLPSNDVKPNHIVCVMQKGFTLNGRVVRPAMVAVAKAQPQSEQQKVNLEA